jgi:cytochrome P450
MTTQETGRSLYFQTPGEPYAYLEDLRENCPVYWDPMLRGYFVTRYADVNEVMSNDARFRLQTRPEEQYGEHQTKARVVTFRAILHARVMRPYIETVIQPEIDRLIASFSGAGKVELLTGFAEKFPAHVIGILFGLEESDFTDLLAYRNARAAVFNAPPDAKEIAKVAAEWQAKMDARMREVLADHRANPRDDLLTWLIDTKEDGKSIPDEEIITVAVRDILMAGSETVASSICNAIYRMVTVPGLYQKIVDDRSLLPAFVEEALRYDPPVHIFWRAPNEDVELSGCPIAKDKQIYTSIASANRDPSVFPDPDTFDIDRPKGKHITFSVGAHRCPGAWVARNEVEMALEALIDRLPNLRLDPDASPPELIGVALRPWAPLNLLFDVT